MNVKRYVGKSTRDALRLLREELGPDALILANRPCADGVEILAAAAVDTSALTLGAALDPQTASARSGLMPGSTQQPGPSPAEPQAHLQDSPHRRAARDALGGADLAPMSTVSFQDYVRQRLRERPSAGAGSTTESSTPPARGLFAQPVQPVPSLTQIAESVPAADSEVAAAPTTAPVQAAPQNMVQELQSLKGLISRQFDTLRWFDDIARDPVQAALARRMMAAGFSLRLARTLIGRLPAGYSEAQAQAWLAMVLQRNLRCAAPKEGFDAGGVYALLGPTGVGKTTTTAKIAAHHVLEHGAQSVALITVDTYRMGAHEQLRAYGRILNVPVHVAHDAAALHDLLRLRHERQLVLIDTVGLGQRDERIADLLGMLPADEVQRVLVASAAVQAESLEESLSAFDASSARGLILTKLDESARLGGVVDCAIRKRLPLLGFCDGQRVPEDWRGADAAWLIQQALESRIPEAYRLDSQSLATLVGVAASQATEQSHA